jgi:hypothetical protein
VAVVDVAQSTQPHAAASIPVLGAAMKARPSVAPVGITTPTARRRGRKGTPDEGYAQQLREAITANSGAVPSAKASTLSIGQDRARRLVAQLAVEQPMMTWRLVPRPRGRSPTIHLSRIP